MRVKALGFAARNCYNGTAMRMVLTIAAPLLQEAQFLAACVVIALLVVGVSGMVASRLCRWMPTISLWRLPRSAIMVLISVAIVATIMAQKGDRGTGTTGVPSPPLHGGSGVSPLLGGITNTLHFSCISVDTNGDVTLTAAWPEGLLSTGWTIDVLGKGDLRDAAWTWYTNGVVDAGATNISWTLESPSPSNCFFKAVVRDTLVDMDDPDGDGMPDVYELVNSTNPYVPDYAAAPKIVAGGAGADGVVDLATALATSEEYSIIEVAPGIHSGNGWTGLHLPEHPVLVTSPNGGRDRTVTVRYSGQQAAFYLSATQRTETVVQGLCIDLVATHGQQMGFWCGGNLPWSGCPAAGTFRNISMRMPNPGVRYFGWFFRHWESNEVVIAASVINAAGATDVRGVYAVDSPPMSVENCTFANFPPSVGGCLGYGIQYESTSANWGNAPGTIPLEIVNCLFDESFTNAYALAPLEQGVSYYVTMGNCVVPSALAYLPDHEYGTVVTNALTAWCGHLLPGSPAIDAGTDALFSAFDIDGQPRATRTDIGADEYMPDPTRDTDGDGLTDSYEIENGIDPYRADTDFDGVPDGLEVNEDGTNPADPHSFKQRLTVSVTNTVSLGHTVYTAWGYSATGWETNGLEVFPAGFGETNYVNASSQGASHVKAFCDLDDDGEYDAAKDILLVRSIPYGSTAHIVFVFGDVDGDGVVDAQERQEGTDPYDMNNFRMVATVSVESFDVSPGLTNFVSLGYLVAGWEENGVVPFAGNSLAYQVDAITTTGELYVKVFRDLDTNGVYEAGIDALVAKKLTRWDNGTTVTFAIGDSDKDRIPDSVELKEGTDPLDDRSRCFNLSQTYTDVFRTTNALTFAAHFGTTCVYGPCVVTERVWTHDFGHCMTANGEKVSVSVWDDVNQNGECDFGETSNRFVIAVSGHDMVVTNKLSYGNFDNDHNELPDWWETQTGLSAATDSGPYDDTDGDGLINLHEYWTGCDPLTPDGSNTLLSVMARSIDDRLAGKNPTNSRHVYSNYAQLITNAACWIAGIDISCASQKNNTGLPNTRSGTAISPRHIIMASHYSVPTGTVFTFRGNDGFLHARTLVATNRIAGCDINVGVLDVALPSTVSCAKFLPSDYKDFMGTGRGLPTLVFDYERKALVMDLNALPNDKQMLASCHFSNNELRNQFGEDIISGDSGNPRFLVIGNQVVLLHLIWYGGAGSGDFVTLWRNEIQTAMNELAAGYQLETIDLSLCPALNQR